MSCLSSHFFNHNHTSFWKFILIILWLLGSWRFFFFSSWNFDKKRAFCLFNIQIIFIKWGCFHTFIYRKYQFFINFSIASDMLYKFFFCLLTSIIMRYISFWDLTILYLIILIYILIKFKFYSIIKRSTRILTHHIFFNWKNILFHVYK